MHTNPRKCQPGVPRPGPLLAEVATLKSGASAVVVFMMGKQCMWPMPGVRLLFFPDGRRKSWYR